RGTDRGSSTRPATFAAAQHLAGDAPEAARARRVAPLHAYLRERAPPRRAARHPPERAGGRARATRPRRRRERRRAARGRRARQGAPRLAVARAAPADRRRAEVGAAPRVGVHLVTRAR